MAVRSSPKDAFYLLAIVASAVTVTALYFAKIVFVPLALAMLFAFVLTPLVTFLEKRRLGRTLSTLIVVLLTLASVAGVGWVVAKQFVDVVNQLPRYQSNIKEKLDSLHVSRSETISNAAATVNQIRKALVAPPQDTAKDATGGRSPKPSAPRQPLPVEIVQPARLPIESLQSVLGLFLQVLIVIVFTIFMLLRRESLRNRFISLAGQRRMTALTYALNEAGNRVGRYLRTQLAVNAIYGAAIGVGLHFIGIPGGLLWGVAVGLLRFLPYVGPPLGGIMPVLMALAIFPGWRIPLITFALFLTIELLTAHAVEPMVYGSHTGISPIAILAAAIFWTFLWGPVGLVLSTPLTVCLVVLGRHLPRLGFLLLLLGDEPVLMPDVLVYQRLLAMDQQEAEEVLENLLKEKSLEEVYDSVLIPALNLAEQDHHRGQIDEDAARFIYQSTKEIVDVLRDRSIEFDSHKIAIGPGQDVAVEKIPRMQPRQRYRVLCLPARDEADEVVAMMLAQLLERAGHAADCAPPGPLVEMIERLRVNKPDLVCISALPPFVISHTRALYRRIKEQSPELQVIVALWGFTGDVGRIASRVGIGEDVLPVTTLRDAVHGISDSEGVIHHRVTPSRA